METSKKKVIKKKNKVSKEELTKLLQTVYGYPDFRPNQYEIIEAVIERRDVCAVLPTGHGKSLTFQLPAIHLKKPALVITPLISLMNDQVMRLNDVGMSACSYSSQSDKADLRKKILKNSYQFIYITPESLLTSGDFLKVVEEKYGFSLVAIDEAHCISAYGFDFRDAYRNLSCIREYLPKVPILALTATATGSVIKDIKTVLSMKEPLTVKASYDRPNLMISCQRRVSAMKQIVSIISDAKKLPAIIYCISRKETEETATKLKERGVSAEYYHAGMDDELRMNVHHRFLKDDIKIVVATIAFGMGIDKPNVRTVIHIGTPKNMESYYQEIGRAGRDGKQSFCYLFWKERDFQIQRWFIKDIKHRDHKHHLFQLIEKMEEYVSTTICRRRYLLGYFNENYLHTKCVGCDICGIQIVTKKLDFTREAFHILSMVCEDDLKKDIILKHGAKQLKEDKGTILIILDNLIKLGTLKLNDSSQKYFITSKGLEMLTSDNKFEITM
jgi:RecQ family ATP-dependent DNA helicase